MLCSRWHESCDYLSAEGAADAQGDGLLMMDDKIGGYKQKNKKSVFLFGFVFDLHYLCSGID